KYASDRVRTTSTVWMGSTVGCAECHDHKFDPFTAKDFYQFAAFFADIKEEGVYSGGNAARFLPILHLPDDDQKAKLEEMDGQLAAVEAAAAPLNAVLGKVRASETPLPEAKQAIAAQLQVSPDVLEKDYEAWVATHERVVRANEAMEIPLVTGESGGAAKSVENWHVVSKENRKAREQSGSEIVRHLADGFAPPEPLQDADAIYAWVYLDPENPPSGLRLELKAAGWDHRAWWGDETIVADVSGEDGPARRRAGDLPEAGGGVRLQIPAAKIGLTKATRVQGIALVQNGGRAWWGSAGFLGKQRGLPKNVVAALKTEQAERDEAAQRVLLAHYFDANHLWETSKQH
ncbi:MAG: DUF1549 domain-containing protein, partial [Phycisphaeraceae bacterium]